MKTSKDKQGSRATAIPSEQELEASPGYPKPEAIEKGPIVVIECVQDIPCNPCETACPNGAIVVGTPITNLPVFLHEKCDGCGRCIPLCPGQAIFRVDRTYSKEKASVSFPYEFQPMPKKGDRVQGVNRAGEVVCDSEVLKVQNPRGFDHTAVVTITVPKNLAMEVRSIKCLASRRG